LRPLTVQGTPARSLRLVAPAVLSKTIRTSKKIGETLNFVCRWNWAAFSTPHLASASSPNAGFVLWLVAAYLEQVQSTGASKISERRNSQTCIAIAIALAIGALMSWAGSDGGDSVGSMPVFALCGALAFLINWLAFIPSALARTERYYDLIGGITYITITAVAVLLSRPLDLRAMLAAAMVIAWALRLSIFLFLRISYSGHDSRFDEIRNQPLRFFMAWTLQGLWVLLTAATALVIVTGGVRVPLGPIGIVGFTVWAIGMLVEIVADRQKSIFRADPENKGKFINLGLWAWSRHPNYFGEIVLWTGVAIMAVPVLSGLLWATLISPVFVALLLIKVSGIPLLEAKADTRWGGEDDYEDYKRRTPVLIPWPRAKQ
jgi:steroid 5-alpha reductase family enzyme